MQITFNKYLKFKYIINLLIAILPLSFIAGNLIINLNVLLIILSSLIFFNLDFFKFKYYLVDKLLIIFFFYSLFVGILNFYNFPETNNKFVTENLIKSIVFFRYLLLYFSIRIILKNNLLNFKIFYVVSTLCALFVSLDLIFQLISGSDIFGNIKTSYKLSGPFGSEEIAGSYLQRFSIFSFFLFASYIGFKNKNKLIFILSVYFALIFFSVLISGNRMPTILFLLMFAILFLYEKKLRKYTLLYILLSLILFIIIFKFSPQITNYTLHFINRALEIFVSLYDVILGKELAVTNTYIKEFYTGYNVWIENFFLGVGINAFHINCAKTISYCASHPHNYYLEILSELGIIGFFLIVTIFTKALLMIDYKNHINSNFNNNLIYPFILLFIVEIFPFKTSGSFFTTGNATFIFIIMAILVGLSKKHTN